METSNNFSAIRSKLITSYLSNKSGFREAGRDLPSTEDIDSLLSLLLNILFPGYLSDNNSNDRSNLNEYVDNLLQRSSILLNTLISASICKEMTGSDNPKHATRVNSHVSQISKAFLQKIPEIRQRLLEDVDAAYQGDPAAKCLDEIILSYPGVYSISVYRLAHELLLLEVPLLPRMMSELAHRKTGIDIHPGASIGTHCFIDHGTGVVIGETARIKNNVKIYQGVTLGALSIPKSKLGQVSQKKRHPMIGNDVTIYANATILGGTTNVGDNCIIGGLTFITKSIEPSNTVKIELPKLKLGQVRSS